MLRMRSSFYITYVESQDDIGLCSQSHLVSSHGMWYIARAEPSLVSCHEIAFRARA